MPETHRPAPPRPTRADIYKVYQTGDLANMSRLDEASLARLPRLDSLRRHIYGPEFRSFVRTITGCDELTDRTDLSCNCYAKGCHLLCHDDVIGTRCISFIIYLTDPDDVYTEEDGGALELFPLEAPDKLGESGRRGVRRRGLPGAALAGGPCRAIRTWRCGLMARRGTDHGGESLRHEGTREARNLL